MDFDGIKGDVTTADYKGWIELNSFQFGVSRGVSSGAGMRALNVSNVDISKARARLTSGAAPLFACRFRADRICPAAKLERLQQEFSAGLEIHEYADHDWRNALGAGQPHDAGRRLPSRRN